MSIDVLILLFIAFSAVSSVINKLKQRSADEDTARRREARQQELPEYGDEDEDPVDLSEWDVFRESPQQAEELPSPVEREPVPQSEFREVRGSRPVEEPGGRSEEYVEVRGARQVEEPTGVQEFREVEWAKPITETPGELEISRQPRASRPQLRRPRTRRRVRLDLRPQSVREGILYSEILGPCRAVKEWEGGGGGGGGG